MPVKRGTTAIESIQNGAITKAYVGNSLVFQTISAVEYTFTTTGVHNIATLPSSWSNIYIDIKGAGGSGGICAGMGLGEGGTGGALTYIAFGAKQILLLAGERGDYGDDGGGGPGGGGAGGEDGESLHEYAVGGRGGAMQIDPILQSYLTIDRSGGGAGGPGDDSGVTRSGRGGNGGRVCGIIPKSALSGLTTITIRVGAGGSSWYTEGAGSDGYIYMKIY